MMIIGSFFYLTRIKSENENSKTLMIKLKFKEYYFNYCIGRIFLYTTRILYLSNNNKTKGLDDDDDYYYNH